MLVAAEAAAIRSQVLAVLVAVETAVTALPPVRIWQPHLVRRTQAGAVAAIVMPRQRQAAQAAPVS